MSSLNRVALIGNLGADPETRAFSDGAMVCNINIATSETWKDRVTGEQKEATEWHRVVLYRRLAEIADQYLRKGAQIYVEGKLRTKKWTDKTGVERYITQIEADELKMLGKPNQATTNPWQQSSGSGAANKTVSTKPPGRNEPGMDSFEDDGIPF
ncbi:MAG: single-stranded DNA-binding protein [Rhodocyclaceae bacterium]|nr:single-stranded DNA-binding protein [Rhodocyclaceae bacterium]